MDTKAILWANVNALMLHHWQESNLQRLARECGIGPATCQRIKQQQTATGLDTLDAIASAFKLQPWQLLLPDLDATDPQTSCYSSAEIKLFAKLGVNLKPSKFHP